MSSPESNTIGICGAGQMGAALAVCVQRAGLSARLWLRNAKNISSTRQVIDTLSLWMESNIGAAPLPTRPCEVTTDLDAIDRDCDVIIDCIAERMEDKIDLFRRCKLATTRRALFLTTTSGLSISQMAQQCGNVERLVGAHFWNPPHLMPLVEVVSGEQTSNEAVEAAMQLMGQLGKIPVRVNRDVPGFIGNRLLHALWREAISLVQCGVASPADIDRVARLTFGLRMPAVGPLENMDLVGLDLVHAIHSYLLPDLANSSGPLPILNQKIEAQNLGIKTGEGFYNWRERESAELLERRNQQIVHQLRYLRDTDNL